MRTLRTGYTLVELMVVLAIVGIMATIAIVSYEQYIRKGKQENLKARILEAASAQERHFAARSRYATVMAELVPFGLTGKAGTNGWETEKATLYTGVFIDDRTGLGYWIAGNADLDKTADTIEDCWLYLSRNATPQPSQANNGLLYLYDDMANAQKMIMSGFDHNVLCKP